MGSGKVGMQNKVLEPRELRIVNSRVSINSVSNENKRSSLWSQVNTPSCSLSDEMFFGHSWLLALSGAD